MEENKLESVSQYWASELSGEGLATGTRIYPESAYKNATKVYRGIDLLKLFGYQLGEPHVKTLKDADGLKELQIKLATDICRFFYFHQKDRIYVCTSGYIKNSNNTDEQEIQRALRVQNDFLKEHRD